MAHLQWGMLVSTQWLSTAMVSSTSLQHAAMWETHRCALWPWLVGRACRQLAHSTPNPDCLQTKQMHLSKLLLIVYKPQP